MIDTKRLLADLKRLRRTLDADLRTAHATGTHRDAVQAEWQGAFDSGRTRETFEAFLDAAFDQSVVHWVLGCVFLRFLEDNGLVDRPFLSGPSEDRRDLARERQETYFRARPHDSDAEYLLATFEEAAQLPGLSGLFDPAHNPLFRLPLSGDGAMALLRFFREVVPETGALAHDFTDAEWNTRFLGDLYQDLSEDARKRYALLQTPDFVEAWILDRTLEPAIQEFGHEQLRMIDPACGSGHFLLGGFTRLLREWQRHAPGLPATEQAQRALDGVAGVDLNPFAVEIARFRLLVAALRAGGVSRLASAPAFRMHLAAGDSLLHGRHFARHELGGAAEGFRRVLRHHYVAEDTAELDAILGCQYHAVVGNPPYITPKDAAMRDAYREIYTSCHMKYGLGAPFTERFFDLALQGTRDRAAGFVGLIVANSFMKREFGKKLIEEVLPQLDLTHVVDCSGAYIPGHGTPTVILFGRNRTPVASVIRTVRGVRGEPSAPDDPARGLVWSAIVAQTDQDKSESGFISTEDTPRATLNAHPWNMGGGGAAEVQEVIEEDCAVLGSIADSVGIASFTLEDDLFLLDARSARRKGIEPGVLRPSLSGDEVRDWLATTEMRAVFPYDNDFEPLVALPRNAHRHMWLGRNGIGNAKMFGGRTKVECGLAWFEFGRLTADKLRTPLTITFGEVATHNHFVLDRGGKVFNRTAPVIKLPAGMSEDEHLGLLGLLNSSTACFWLKQVCHNKGATVDDRGARQRTDPFEDFYQLNGTRVGQFPLTTERPLDLARALDTQAQHLSANLPAALCTRIVPTRGALDAACTAAEAARARMIALQEELDWRCYRLYGLQEAPPEHSDPPPLRLGERAFEIVMARRMAAGNLETAWFERHRSTSITDLPTHWPAEYRAVVERRIELIESDPTIGLIERPEYKRRWSSPTWEEMEQDALRAWLLDRLEDGRLWPSDDPRLVSTNQLADLLRRDADFLTVAGVYRGRPDFDLEALVAELVAKEAVPFLSVLRYSETGLRKREQWEQTWELQRREDAIDTEVAARCPDFMARAELAAQESWRGFNPRRPAETPEAYAARMAAGVDAKAAEEQADRLIAQEQARRKREEVGQIPVPPKYRTPDFQSQDFWRLRGGLDVPKERFVSFPGCHRDADGSLVVTWAGYDHLARARAIAAYYLERREADGWPGERLVPMLAGLIELLPWLRQWHNDYDPDTGERMGDYFAAFVNEEARSLGMTEAAVAAWKPAAAPRRGRGRRAAA
jgi:hypothetical protein